MDKVMELYVRSMVVISQPRKGQGLVEYALIIALVSIALVLSLTALAGGIDGVFDVIVTKL